VQTTFDSFYFEKLVIGQGGLATTRTYCIDNYIESHVSNLSFYASTNNPATAQLLVSWSRVGRSASYDSSEFINYYSTSYEGGPPQLFYYPLTEFENGKQKYSKLQKFKTKLL